MTKSFSLLIAAMSIAVTASARDIKLEEHVRKYWSARYSQSDQIGSGDKRWPLTPELKAERLRHFTGAVQRFAPHLIEEAKVIDRVFSWQEGTYLGMMRFGVKKAEVKAAPAASAVNPAHECTSWVVMDDLTGGKSFIMHKNRDSRARPLTLLRRAVPGKHAWIGNGGAYSFEPTQGINDRGVVILMNSGDPHAEAENSQYGMGTPIICRILLEEAGSAEEAVELLKKIVRDNAYTHVESGSIWFIGDAENVYIVENHARKIVTKAVNRGFAIRANAFQYPEMQKYSLRSFGSLLAQSKREFTVRNYLVNQQWRKNGFVTALDNAAASRIDKVQGDKKCYPPCGRSTISACTFVIDKEYPEYLSTAYMTFSSPKNSCYLPVPLTLKNIPEALKNGSYSMHSFKLMDKKAPLMDAEKLKVLEERIYSRHQQALEKARIILRTSSKHTTQSEIAELLNTAFEQNFQDILETINAPDIK